MPLYHAFVGLGSNLLGRDGGLKGAVISGTGAFRELEKIGVDDTGVRPGPADGPAKDMGSAAQFMGLVMIVVCWTVILL